MKLLKTDRSDGYAEIEVENEDDLWRLEPLVSPGDPVRKFTQRTKLDGREKKSLELTLEVEQTELRDGRLRLTGEIQQAEEDVELGYHTFNVEPGDQFELWKEFTDAEWEELQEAERSSSHEVLFALVEKGEADLYRVRESGVRDLSGLSRTVPGKMYEDSSGSDFHSEVAEAIERSAEDVDHVVLAGPGFEKQNVAEELPGELMEDVLVQDTSVTGETGLNEAIKRGALERVVESSRIADESEAVEEFLEALESGGKADYGDPVEELAEVGAVEKLLVTPERARENRETVEAVERQGGEVQTVHTDHEAGERLENLGGIAAILRYRP